MKKESSQNKNKADRIESQPPKILGTQWIIELYQCNPDVLNDENKIEAIMLEAAEAANATVVNHCFHRFSPQGVSGVVVISESHLAVHTWPEYRYCAVDIFTCSNEIEHLKAVRVLKEGLQSGEENLYMVERGIRNRAPESIPLISKNITGS